MESGKGKHLRKVELWIRLERVMMAKQKDVRTEDTGGWDVQGTQKGEDAEKVCQ